ncbi:MAG: Na+/H+ antiporter NhaA [bacterium]|nr:Na+/H+ antiporter NhaA [bacterium]MDE0287342.1 Na+/H+ antiporter NhaA [bacterium]MDE0439161.1 Na+/H+ antiporter NhaA [bacterium]
MTSARKNWISSDRFIPRRFVRPALELTHRSAASGIVLVIAAVIAMLWANLPVFGDSYQTFWHDLHLDLSLGPVHLYEDLKHLVNDGLMTIFFLVVGLEIKRELVLGELRDPRKAALPVFAALGGMVVPALIYVALNAGDAAALRGWGVPMATDIAFSLGVLALVGSRAPVGVRLFLLAVAIADDIGAIAVIAIFYTADLDFGYLGLGIGTLVLIAIGARVNIRSYMFYVPMGLIAWFGFLESGVHATIAGVILGFITPSRPLYDSREFDRAARRIVEIFPADSPEPYFREKVEYEARMLSDVARESIAPLSRVEHLLHGWSAFVIVPIFALANAGVSFAGIDLADAITSEVALGVAVGLVVGKTVGVTGFGWLVVKLGLGRLPSGVGWRHMTGTAMLAGIGFTVALFIAELAYTDYLTIDLAKIGIFLGSIIAGVLGYLVLRTAPETGKPSGMEGGSAH